MADSAISKQMEHLTLRRHKTSPCMFQKGKHLHTIDETKEQLSKQNSDNAAGEEHDRADEEHETVNTSSENTETGGQKSEENPKLKALFKARVYQSKFISKTKAAVARRRRIERPWMKGNEMRPFYHLWEQEQSTPKGRKLRRVNSLPRDFRLPDVRGKKPPDLGIVRECCSKIRSRLPTYPFEL